MVSKLLLSAKLFKKQMKSLADSNNKESEMGNDIFSEAIGKETKVSWQEAGAIQHAAMHGKKSLLLELQSQLHARVIACQLGNGFQCGRGSGKRSDLLGKGEKLVGRKRELKLIAGNGDIGSDKSSAQAGT